MLFIIWVLFGIGAAIAASNKGRSSLGWFLLGILLGPFALLYVLLVPVIKLGGSSSLQELLENETKICPHCAEAIKLSAKKSVFAERFLMRKKWRGHGEIKKKIMIIQDIVHFAEKKMLLQIASSLEVALGHGVLIVKG
ncbi:MAG: hypothetical protein ACOZF2_13730 [Thermodesulfobacteriota bacterium]